MHSPQPAEESVQHSTAVALHQQKLTSMFEVMWWHHLLGLTWKISCWLDILRHSHPSLSPSPGSFPYKWSPRQVFLQKKARLCIWQWRDVPRTYARMLLSPVCLPLANTKTIVFRSARSILATLHLSFTSIPACPFSSVKWKDASLFFPG